MKVLIIDDDFALVWMIRDSMNWEKLGIHQVFTANSAEKAREIIAEEDVDIVISDIEMPRESGLDLLKWYRAENYSGKFLLLTAHEKFNYAMDALRYHADEYLTKPFDVKIMDMVLQKIVRELALERKERDYQMWSAQNARLLRTDFLENWFSGRNPMTEEELKEHFRNLQVGLDLDWKYRLVVSRAVNSDYARSNFGEDFLDFFLEQMHQEMLSGEAEGYTLVLREENEIHVAAILPEGDERELRESGNALMNRVDHLTDLSITICIGESVEGRELAKSYQKISDVLTSKITYWGTCFLERDAVTDRGDQGPILDMKKLDALMEQKDRRGILEYVKKEIDHRTRNKTLDRTVLDIIQAEIRQSVYSYLSGKGIQITSVIDTEDFERMSRTATTSGMHMIKWTNYILDRTFTAERDYNPRDDIADRIDRYIEEHYMEDIGRNEIGAHFFLVPEYVSRLYKKRTGVNLKDAINEYRIGRAKVLLLDPSRSISDIASDVGFGNLSYFSTMFKKSVGVTPNEYRRNSLQ